MPAFAWQAGYGVFSVSKSQADTVRNYVAAQRERHKHEDFKSELLRMLRLNEISFDEKHVFERVAAQSMSRRAERLPATTPPV